MSVLRNPTSEIPVLPLTEKGQPSHFVAKPMQLAAPAPGRKKPHIPHRHDFFSIIWTVKATGTHHIDFLKFPLGENTIFFLAPEQVHYVESVQPEGYVLMFTAEFLQANGLWGGFFNDVDLFFDCEPKKPVVAGPQLAGQLEKQVLQMMEECRGNNALKDHALGAMLKLFLVTCHRAALHCPASVRQEPGAPARLAKDFKALLEKHFRQNHKVADYASLLAVTANHLNSTIKAETGRSAKEMIFNRLVLEAKRLAHYSGISTKEAAYQLGFADPAHFSKFFKNSAGSTFSEFRDSLAAY